MITEIIPKWKSTKTTFFYNVSKWTNEMKVNLLKIEKREKNQVRGFMKQMKEAWDAIYENSMMSAQTLRHNAARFQKDKSLLNLIEMREGGKVGRDEIRIIQERSEVNVERNENDERRKLKQAMKRSLRFEDILNTLTPSTKENIERNLQS